MLFQREIPVRERYDVVIAGGGPAGCAAAVTAAEAGARVFLADSQGCLGGLGTAGGVPLFMRFGSGGVFFADGFGRRVLEAHNREGVIHRWPELINAERLKRIYDRMLGDAGVTVSLLTTLIAAECDGDRVNRTVFHAKSGLFAIEGAVFVDATGDADLTVFAGGETEFGDEHGKVMPGTLCSGWANIDWERFYASGENPRRILLDAFRDGVFRRNDPHHTGITPSGDRLGGGNMGHFFDWNPLDERELTGAMVEGRLQMVEFARFYREYVTGFEQAELSFTAALPGVRASRRIVGDYKLDLDDYLARRHFADEIGCYCYSIDIHPVSTDAAAQAEFERLHHAMRYQPGESYGIPFRTLCVRNRTNLLAAGRCIGTDHYLQASVRVMPGCFLTGQAAGMAAALAVEAGDCAPRRLDALRLRSALRRIGAWLPEPDELTAEAQSSSPDRPC